MSRAIRHDAAAALRAMRPPPSLQRTRYRFQSCCRRLFSRLHALHTATPLTPRRSAISERRDMIKRRAARALRRRRAEGARVLMRSAQARHVAQCYKSTASSAHAIRRRARSAGMRRDARYARQQQRSEDIGAVRGAWRVRYAPRSGEQHGARVIRSTS